MAGLDRGPSDRSPPPPANVANVNITRTRSFQLFANSTSSGDVIDKVEVILGKGSLNETGMEMKYRRREVLREISAPLSLRRQAMHRMNQFQNSTQLLQHQPRKVGWVGRARFWMAHSYQKTIGPVVERGNYYALWASRIKSIEGQMGSGIGTYFHFLKFLLVLNCNMFILTLSFIVIPQLLDRFYDHGTVVPKPYYNGTAKFGDFLTGHGWLEDTELFFGIYTTGKILAVPDVGSYDMSQAYYYTMFSTYILTMLIIAISMARSYKKNFIETEEGVTKSIFCKSVFSSCDFAISRKKTLKLQSESALNEIRDSLDRRRKTDKSGGKNKRFGEGSTTELFLKIMSSIVINLVVIGILVGVGFLANFLIDQFGSEETTDDFWRRMSLSLALSGVILVFPIFFSILGSFEYYLQVRTRVYLGLCRTMALEIVVLGMVMVKYLIRSSESSSETLTNVCWETRVGQEMYRFMVTFFIVLVLVDFLAELTKILLHNKARLTWLGSPEFDIARNTMHLIYGQTVVLLGHYFSPMLPLVFAIILVISFYLKMGLLKLNSGSSRKHWRAAQSKTIFLVFLFFSCAAAFCVYGYIIIGIGPSGSCGPFKDMVESHPYEMMAQAKFFSTFFLFQPGVVAGLLVALCVTIFYVRSVAMVHKRTADGLRRRIRAEAADKLFLVRQIKAAVSASAARHRQLEAATRASTRH